MTDSLGDLLAHKDFDEPPEMRAIKAFIKDHYQADAEVLMRGERDIVITVRSGALANTLRLNMPELKKAASTDKRLIFRIR